MKSLKKFFLFLIFSVELSAFFAQSSVNLRNIRIALWAELDVYPELYEKNENPLSYSKTRIVELSRFLFAGMVYGWNFVYTPYDAARGVEEYFEVTPIQELSEADTITYSDSFFEDNKITVWCNFTRKDFQIQNYELWASIQNPVIKGRGTGDIKNGFAGIETALKNSIKNAVREHYRKEIKNKPKEISGSVLIRQAPLIGISEGQYTIFLDFFLERDKIINYTAF